MPAKRGHQIPIQIDSYKPCMWLLGIELITSDRAVSAFNCQLYNPIHGNSSKGKHLIGAGTQF